jgi:hypothetical protein
MSRRTKQNLSVDIALPLRIKVVDNAAKKNE